jgi:hypothetical protein
MPAAMSLNDYKEAKARWLEWLDGDPVHSINGQLSQLLWEDAVFRSFNEARKDTETKGPSAAVAPILAQFLDRGYIASQVLGISKLVEWSDPKRPQKGVVSLRRLVDELLGHRALLTRENFLAAEGAPYDYAPIRAQAIKAMLERGKAGVAVEWIGEGEASWSLAERMHEQFDRLSNVEQGERRPGDLVSEDLLARLDAALKGEVFEKIRTVRHKTVAHAADAVSRPEDGVGGISFNDVDQAVRALLGVRQVIQAGILFSSWRAASVPVPQHDQFKYLDLPFVGEGGAEKLQAFWSRHCEERDKWLRATYDEIMK